nr:ATP-binding protein [Dysgonomonas sp. BGC7]
MLDDFGLQAFDSQARVTLLDIIEDRHGKKSTLITSLCVKCFYDIDYHLMEYLSIKDYLQMPFCFSLLFQYSYNSTVSDYGYWAINHGLIL